MRTAVVCAFAVALAACAREAAPRDQWTVWVTTDAPAPQLVDRALIEVIDETGELACDDCRRQLGVPIDPAAWPFSFGVAKSPGVGELHVRVRLYRAASAGPDGLPGGSTTLDLLGALPAASGDTEVHMALSAECLGVASDSANHMTCEGPDRALVPERTLPSGKPDSSVRPGAWPRAVSTPCTRTTPDGMVCIPGGFFVLGDARALSTGASDSATPRDERFVTVSPFAIDRDEVTVGTVRSLERAGKLAAPPQTRGTPLTLAGKCTYLGRDDAANDAFAVNCVSALTASEVCAALGKRLPTEAEWEWVAGNLSEETRYPWGDIGDPCDFVDVGLGVAPDEIFVAESTACRIRIGQPTRPAGLPAQANAADVTSLGVRRLGGGVSEWVADRLAPYRAACWRPDEPFLTDPRCDDPALPAQAVRGSSWADAPGLVDVVGRQGIGSGTMVPTIGFRCARSDSEAP